MCLPHQCNLVVQFSSDSLDQSPRLATLLKRKFGAFGVPASPPSSAGSTAAFNRAEAAATREGSDVRSDSEGGAGGGAASAAAAQQELEVCVYVLVHSPEKAVRSF